MASDSKQNLKTLRVDNWALFFLQRLQLMFAKGDCCDLTLKFHTGQELKVHRLVLVTCTSFFEDMHKDGDVISMPETLPYSVVQPIINFLYSGKLEFKSELHSQLLNISKSLNITILAKLLITQKNDNGLGTVKNDDGKKSPQRTFLATRIGPAPSKTLANKKLPIWRQRAFPLFKPPERRIIKDEEPKPRRFEWPDGQEPSDCALLISPSFTPLSYSSENVFSSPRKPRLNVDSDDSYLPPLLPQSTLKRPSTNLAPPLPDKFFKPNPKDDHRLKESDELASETIEQADFSDDDDGHFETIHSFGDSDDEQEVEQTTVPLSHSTPKPVTPPSVRASQTPPSQMSTVHHTYPPPAKQLSLVTIPTAQTVNNVKPVEHPPTSTITSVPLQPKPILKPNAEPVGGPSSAKKVRFSIAEDDRRVQHDSKFVLDSETVIKEELSTDTISLTGSATASESVAKLPKLDSELVQVLSPTHRTAKDPPVSESLSSITVPAVVSATPSTSSSLSFPETSLVQTTKPAVTYSTKTPMKSEKKTSNVSNPANHAKIIAEVLKKYPELVKNNKNIRLKISAPGTTNVTNTITLDTKKTPGKASFMVVKSTVKTENSVKSPKADLSSSSSIVPSSKTYTNTTNVPSTAGPWLCTTCSKDGENIEFGNYRDYRLHLQDEHNQKFDSRTCEYCGYKTSKRNLLLYHLFTKHDVPPPQNFCFPKCDQCGYVALSEGLLQKHVATHKNMPKEWPCPRCNAVLNTYPNLQTHLTTCKQPEPVNLLCTFCNEVFKSGTALDKHASTCQGSVSSTNDNITRHIYEETVEGRVNHEEEQQAVEMIEVPIMDHNTIANRGEHTYVQLPNGLILIPADNQQHVLRHPGNIDGQERREMVMTSVGRGFHRPQTSSDVQLLTASSGELEQMAVTQNVALLHTPGGEDMNARNNMGAPIGLTVTLPQDQHVILLEANSEFFIQGNDSVVVSRMNNNPDEYIVPEVLEDNIHQLYSTQTIPYTVTTTPGNMITCPVIPIQSTAGQTDKPEENLSNTVVTVQDHIEPTELENVHIQHHVDESDIESIIVHDSASENEKLEQQQRCLSGTPVDIFVEEPQPARHSMTINKELMEVVAMEVQRSPNLMGHNSVVVSLPQSETGHGTILRSTLSQSNQLLRSEKSTSVSTSSDYFKSPSCPPDHPAGSGTKEENMIVTVDLTDTKKEEDEDVSETSPDTRICQTITFDAPQDNEEMQVTDVDESNNSVEVEKLTEEQVAKADSLVKDWGFDAEEEGDDAVQLNDDEDSSDDESAVRSGPSRVTVEL